MPPPPAAHWPRGCAPASVHPRSPRSASTGCSSPLVDEPLPLAHRQWRGPIDSHHGVDVLLQPSASYSFILRTETSNRPGTLGRVTTAIGEEGGDIGAIDIVRVGGGKMVRDLTVAARDEAHADTIVRCVRSLDGVNVLHVTDRTFLVHLGGKIEINSRVPVKGRDDLSMIYTPGVARVCLAIRDDPASQWTLTAKRHTVAVVTDG